MTDVFEDMGEIKEDEHHVAYSLDGHRLLFAKPSFKDEEYHVPWCSNHLLNGFWRM